MPRGGWFSLIAEIQEAPIRPLGVTLIAIYQFLRGGLGVLFALLVWLASGLASKLASLATEGNVVERLFAGAGRFFEVALLVYALIHIVLGFGLLSQQNWARLLTIVFAAISLLTLLPRLIHPSPMALLVGVINIACIVYLLMPGAKRAFQS